MKQTTLLILGFVVFVVVGAVLLMTRKGEETPDRSKTQPKVMETQQITPTQAVMEKTSESTPSPNVSTNTKAVTMAAQNFAFSVKEIRVKKGDTVSVTLKVDQGNHNWIVDEFNAKTKTISSGQQDTATFIVDKAGTFEYYCGVGSHRQMGMVGKLIVE